MSISDWHDYPGADAPGHTVVGEVKRLISFHSPELGNGRDIYVYLPPSYGRAPERRYPVLYMQDGQNLFDEATAFAGAWAVDRTMEQASRDGLEAIVVGVPNMGGARFAEYTPFRDGKHGGGRGEEYLTFLARTLKARIDADFRTRPGRESTGIMGSSLGALISLYGFFARPGVFGFAGVMSPALWPAQHRILTYLERAPSPPGRLYVDVGTREGWGELRDVRRLRKLLERKGYERGRHLLYLRERGGRHRERAWGRRFRRAVDFLLAGQDKVEVEAERRAS
jgi:predicted alpha/beta superfamily hydrolase